MTPRKKKETKLKDFLAVTYVMFVFLIMTALFVSVFPMYLWDYITQKDIYHVLGIALAISMITGVGAILPNEI